MKVDDLQVSARVFNNVLRSIGGEKRARSEEGIIIIFTWWHGGMINRFWDSSNAQQVIAKKAVPWKNLMCQPVC